MTRVALSPGVGKDSSSSRGASSKNSASNALSPRADASIGSGEDGAPDADADAFDTQDTNSQNSHTETTESDRSYSSTCPECLGEIAREGGEWVCQDCGLVASESNLSRKPGRYDDSDGQVARRCGGAPETPALVNRGLGSTFSAAEADNDSLASDSGKFFRLKEKDDWRQGNEENLLYAFSEVRRLCPQIGVDERVRDRASMLFRRAHEADLVADRDIDQFTAAVTYAACRLLERPRTLSEIVDFARTSEQDIWHAYGLLNREFGLPVRPLDPDVFVPRYCSALNLPGVIRESAETLSELAKANGLGVNRQPNAVAATAIYVVSNALDAGPELSMRDVADCADVSPHPISDLNDELSGLFRTLCVAAEEYVCDPTTEESLRVDLGESTLDADTSDTAVEITVSTSAMLAFSGA